jgi:hypothetical protein
LPGRRGRAARLLGRRHVAAHRLAEVVHHADLHEAREVDAGKAGGTHRHQAEPPRVLGHALALAADVQPLRGAVLSASAARRKSSTPARPSGRAPGRGGASVGRAGPSDARGGPLTASARPPRGACSRRCTSARRVDVGVHRAREAGELAGARVGDRGDGEALLAARHHPGVLEDEGAAPAA